MLDVADLALQASMPSMDQCQFGAAGLAEAMDRFGDLLAVGGEFTVECFGPDGKLKWKDTAKNAVTNGALDDVLNIYLRNGTPKAAWYTGLVDNASFTTFAAADTISSHGGWIENTSYSETNRVTWSPAQSSGQSVTNSSAMTFSINATVTIKGLFIVSDNSKGGTSGLLFSTAAFTGGSQSANNGDSLKLTYTVSATTS